MIFCINSLISIALSALFFIISIFSESSKECSLFFLFLIFSYCIQIKFLQIPLKLLFEKKGNFYFSIKDLFGIYLQNIFFNFCALFLLSDDKDLISLLFEVVSALTGTGFIVEYDLNSKLYDIWFSCVFLYMGIIPIAIFLVLFGLDLERKSFHLSFYSLKRIIKKFLIIYFVSFIYVFFMLYFIDRNSRPLDEIFLLAVRSITAYYINTEYYNVSIAEYVVLVLGSSINLCALYIMRKKIFYILFYFIFSFLAFKIFLHNAYNPILHIISFMTGIGLSIKSAYVSPTLIILCALTGGSIISFASGLKIERVISTFFKISEDFKKVLLRTTHIYFLSKPYNFSLQGRYLHSFFFLYFLTFVLSILLLSHKFHSIYDTFVLIVSSLTNNAGLLYSLIDLDIEHLDKFVKVILVFIMIIGRFDIVVLFSFLALYNKRNY